MGKTRKTSKKQKNIQKKIIIGVIAAAILSVIIVVANLDYGYISDKKKAADFHPTKEVSELISKMRLTEKARIILYASNPQLKSKAAFNGICGRDGDPRAYIAGCYYVINDEEYIDIYDSGKDASELENAYYNYENAKVVTLSHEMMHAAYSRLPDSEKEWIEIELNKIFANDSNLQSELAHYPSNQRFDELYVRVATEVYGIPANLEKHYAKYFKDRQYIAKLYHDTKDQIDRMYAEADIILQRLETQRSLYDNSDNYYTRRNALSEIYRLLDLYNAQIGVYRETLNKRDSEK